MSAIREIPIQFPDDDALCNLIADQLVAAGFTELARQLRIAVNPKRQVDEPTEWGSVIRARRVGYGAEDTTRLRWQRQNTRDANDSWVSEPAGDLGVRYSSHWSYLVDPEVLRVGVGEPA